MAREKPSAEQIRQWRGEHKKRLAIRLARLEREAAERAAEAQAIYAVLLARMERERREERRRRKLGVPRPGLQRRYYISFSPRPAEWRPHPTRSWGGVWRKHAWPILFYSRETAEMAMSCLPIFAEPVPRKHRHDKGPFKSASVEMVFVPAVPR